MGGVYPRTRESAAAGGSRPPGNVGRQLGAVRAPVCARARIWTLTDVATSAGNQCGDAQAGWKTGHVTPSLETLVAPGRGALGVRPAAAACNSWGGDEEGAQRVPAGPGARGWVQARPPARGHTYHLLAAQRGPAKNHSSPFLP